jgi:hypothetical protein
MGRLYWALIFSQAPSLQYEPHLNVGTVRLFPMKHRAARPEIVARIRSVYAINRVLAKIALQCCFLYSIATELFECELVEAARSFDVETDRSRILADWQGARFSKTNVLNY